LFRIAEDGKNWLRRSKFGTKICRAAIRRRRFSNNVEETQRNVMTKASLQIVVYEGNDKQQDIR
jgi:hypothetical protein